MLIICNGAFKSGSSWLHAILVELTIVKKLKIQKVPVKYTNDIHSPTTIVESRLLDFISNEDYITNDYLTKAHFFKESTLQNEYHKEVKMLFIERDRRDAVVSHYFHVRNKYRFKISFDLYYYSLGRYKAYEIGLFNNRCKKYRGQDNLFYFEDLIFNYENTLKGIAKSIGIKEITDQEMRKIEKETTLDKLREGLKKGDISYYPSSRSDNWKLFREGKVGGWKEYFKSNQIKDIVKIENGSFSVFSRLIYFFLFTLRRLIFRIE